MPIQADRLESQIENFGLTKAEVKVYLNLIQEDERTALQISRDLKIGRTKVYRLLENLIEKSLVEQSMSYPGKKFKATSYENLKKQITEQEVKINQLKDSLPALFTNLASLESKNASKSKVLYYKGVEGSKQITWNSLSARSEMRIFEVAENMEDFTNKKFAEKMREEMYLRKILTEQLTNYKSIPEFTEVENYVKKFFQIRYIDPKKLKLDFELLIYNDTVAIYTFSQDIFGIEIYNSDLARMQKQIFDFVWENAKEMYIEKGGRAYIK